MCITLRIFRPNIDPILFDKAREQLFASSSEKENEIWNDRDYPETNQMYIPGRLRSQFIIPTESHIFDRLRDEVMKEDNTELHNFFNELEKQLTEMEYSQYTKALIFANEAGRRGIKLPAQLELFLKSQAIIYGENIQIINLEHDTNNNSVINLKKWVAS